MWSAVPTRPRQVSLKQCLLGPCMVVCSLVPRLLRAPSLKDPTKEKSRLPAEEGQGARSLAARLRLGPPARGAHPPGVGSPRAGELPLGGA